MDWLLNRSLHEHWLLDRLRLSLDWNSITKLVLDVVLLDSVFNCEDDLLRILNLHLVFVIKILYEFKEPFLNIEN